MHPKVSFAVFAERSFSSRNRCSSNNQITATNLLLVRTRGKLMSSKHRPIREKPRPVRALPLSRWRIVNRNSCRGIIDARIA
jgi:hypothetical protein